MGMLKRAQALEPGRAVEQAMREGDRLVDKRTKKKIALAGVVTFMKPHEPRLARKHTCGPARIQ